MLSPLEALAGIGRGADTVLNKLLPAPQISRYEPRILIPDDLDIAAARAVSPPEVLDNELPEAITVFEIAAVEREGKIIDVLQPSKRESDH